LSNLSASCLRILVERQTLAGRKSNFLHSMSRTLPPMMQVMKDIGGVEMRAYLAKLAAEPATAAPSAATPVSAPKPKAPAPKPENDATIK
jgi:hypothetical protein